ncbi:hypothetical protein F0562_014060 [Nyssa sinensis]|uniref:Uncharacterized protein n=1 Tax=Nyssa sinensis TaxID=561372 RepID=A0A5J4ZMN0_9ASTE|nr:hypothetical protein F0562_014060 [Nyssa sinensis]
MKNGGDGKRKTLAVPTTRDEYPPNNTTSSTLQQLSTTAKDGDESKIVGDSLETGNPVGSTAANENSNNAPVSTIQKKIRRAERSVKNTPTIYITSPNPPDFDYDSPDIVGASFSRINLLLFTSWTRVCRIRRISESFL